MEFVLLSLCSNLELSIAWLKLGDMQSYSWLIKH